MVDVTKALKDAGYIAIGMGVMAFQKAQVQRVELTKQFEAQRKTVETQASDAREQLGKMAKQFESQRKAMETQAADAREQLVKLAKGVEEKWEPVIKEIEQRLEDIEARLPEQAATVVKQARSLAKDAQTEIGNLFGGSSSAAA